MRAHDAPDFPLDGIHLRAAVDYFHALGFSGGQRMISLVDLAVKLDRLIVHARFAVRLGFIARPGPRQAGFGIHIHQDGEIGFQAAARDAVQVVHGVDAQIRGPRPGTPGRNR